MGVVASNAPVLCQHLNYARALLGQGTLAQAQHLPGKIAQDRTVRSILGQHFGLCSNADFLYEQRGSTRDPVRKITSARSLAFTTMIFLSRFKTSRFLQRKQLKDMPTTQTDSVLEANWKSNWERNSKKTLFSNQDTTESSKSL